MSLQFFNGKSVSEEKNKTHVIHDRDHRKALRGHIISLNCYSYRNKKLLITEQ